MKIVFTPFLLFVAVSGTTVEYLGYDAADKTCSDAPIFFSRVGRSTSMSDCVSSLPDSASTCSLSAGLRTAGSCVAANIDTKLPVKAKGVFLVQAVYRGRNCKAEDQLPSTVTGYAASAGSCVATNATHYHKRTCAEGFALVSLCADSSCKSCLAPFNQTLNRCDQLNSSIESSVIFTCSDQVAAAAPVVSFSHRSVKVGLFHVATCFALVSACFW